MTIKQCEKRNKEVIINAIKWANNEYCEPLEQLDACIICEYFNMKQPKCICNFVSSNDINSAKCYGSEKSIYNFLDKIQKKLKGIKND